jgi:hypothetical protein
MTPKTQSRLSAISLPVCKVQPPNEGTTPSHPISTPNHPLIPHFYPLNHVLSTILTVSNGYTCLVNSWYQCRSAGSLLSMRVSGPQSRPLYRGLKCVLTHNGTKARQMRRGKLDEAVRWLEACCPCASRPARHWAGEVTPQSEYPTTEGCCCTNCAAQALAQLMDTGA